MTAGIVTERGVEWKSSACILCECNCGILVKLGGEDGRRFEQIREAHPASKGYTCQKALRLYHYQNGRGERVLHPLRRRADGSFEEISWDTAITEVARLCSAGSAPPRTAWSGCSRRWPDVPQRTPRSSGIRG